MLRALGSAPRASSASTTRRCPCSADRCSAVHLIEVTLEGGVVEERGALSLSFERSPFRMSGVNVCSALEEEHGHAFVSAVRGPQQRGRSFLPVRVHNIYISFFEFLLLLISCYFNNIGMSIQIKIFSVTFILVRYASVRQFAFIISPFIISQPISFNCCSLKKDSSPHPWRFCRPRCGGRGQPRCRVRSLQLREEVSTRSAK